MFKTWCVTALCIGASVSAAQAIEIAPKRLKLNAPPPYAHITLMGEGPAYGHTDGDVRGHLNRVVVLFEGLAYDHPVLRIETLTYGDEGCCRRLVRARQIDLNELARKGLKLPQATDSEIESMTWTSPETVTLKYGDRSCQLQGLSKPRIAVLCE